MTDDDLGVPHRAALFALMAVGEEIPNTDLKKRTGIDISGPVRKRLNERGLVDTWKLGRGNANVHELTDEGWRWCAEQLGRDCPPRAGSAGGALYAVLAGLGRYLRRTDLTLADVFGAPPAGGALDPAGDPPARIVAAYQTLARDRGDWVGLAALRAALPDLSRPETDEALRQLALAHRANLAPRADQHNLTAADRDAAVRVGNEDKHTIAIEDL